MAKVRRNRRRRLKDRPLLPFLLLSAPISLIFLFGSLRQSHKYNAKGSKMPKMQCKQQDKPNLSYVLYDKSSVSSKNSTALRYKAMEECQDGAETRPVTVLRWAQLMSHNDTAYATSLAQNLTQVLKDVPFQAFYFETKGVTPIVNAGNKLFEFVLVDAPELFAFADTQANPKAFEEHFGKDSTADGVVFQNLGKSATLIAPKPKDKSDGKDSPYGHLAAFVRRGDQDQVHKIWQIVAETYRDHLESKSSDKPKSVWLSTSGTGIAWLHFRLDDVPKYYTYSEFANET